MISGVSVLAEHIDEFRAMSEALPKTSLTMELDSRVGKHLKSKDTHQAHLYLLLEGN